MSFSILFLCTGNYYRSRYAEILFNTLVARDHLPLHAESRGIATELGVDNIGPLSRYAHKALHHRGIRHPSMERMPMQVSATDLQNANLIIALDADEHRPMMRLRLPDWAEKVEYWSIGDLGVTSPEAAIPALETKVAELIERLRPR